MVYKFPKRGAMDNEPTPPKLYHVLIDELGYKGSPVQGKGAAISFLLRGLRITSLPLRLSITSWSRSWAIRTSAWAPRSSTPLRRFGPTTHTVTLRGAGRTSS